jgi:hypothetical protein
MDKISGWQPKLSQNVGRREKRPGSRDGAQKKINFFLTASRPGVTVFQNTMGMTRLAFLISAARRGFGASERKATRKWRRKPLESLKMDSAMADSRLAGRAGRIDQANSL